MYSLYMAHLHKKMKKGRPYYYVREMARIDGQPKVVKQVYLGSPERILELVSGKQSECTRISVEEFGSLWMAHLIDSPVGLAPLIDSVVNAEIKCPPNDGIKCPLINGCFLL